MIVITGIMAAGKSTVAQLLAESLPRSVHLRGDLFRRMIVQGRVDPTPDEPAEAAAQLQLRYRLATTAALQYVAAGFTVVYQDVILKDDLPRVLSLLAGVPVFAVVLCPPPEVVADREAARNKTGYGGGWTPADLHLLLGETPHLGLWLNTGQWTAPQTVDQIQQRLHEARIA